MVLLVSVIVWCSVVVGLLCLYVLWIGVRVVMKWLYWVGFGSVLVRWLLKCLLMKLV